MKNFHSLKVFGISAVCIIALTWEASGQNIEFSKANFAGQKKELKAALASIKSGDKCLDQEPPEHSKALIHYLSAQKFNPNNAALNRQIGQCFISLNQPANALPYFERSLELDPDQDPDIIFSLARTHHLNSNFESAIRRYNDYLNKLPTRKLKSDSSLVNRYIREATIGHEISTSGQSRVLITHMTLPFNSPSADFLPQISNIDSFWVFSSTRPKNEDSKPSEVLERIFFVRIGPTGKMEVERAPAKLQDKDHHMIALYINSAGDEILIRNGGQTDELTAYRLKKGSWSKDKKLYKKLVKHDGITSFAISPDNKWAAFTAFDKNGQGGSDLFLVKKGDKDWEKPFHAGPHFNSELNETGVCFNHDGTKLFFASQGIGSMGGYDFFESQLTDTGWSLPANVGYPFNTPFNEVYLSFDPAGNKAILSSDRQGGLGSFDLYELRFLGAEKNLIIIDRKPDFKPVEIIDHKQLIRPAIVIVPDDSLMLRVRIQLDSPAHGLTANVMKIPEAVIFHEVVENGASFVIIEVPVHTEYLIFFDSPTLISNILFVDSAQTSQVGLINKDASIFAISSGNPILLPIEFTGDSILLKSDPGPVIHLLKDFILAHPNDKFEISSHAEKSESQGMAIELTSRRAEYLASLLYEAGVSSNNLSARGYGFDRPVSQHAGVNQRVELRYIGKPGGTE